MTSILRYSKPSVDDLDSAWWHRLAQFNPDLDPSSLRLHSPKHSYPWYMPRYIAEHRFFMRPFHRMNHIPPWRLVTQTKELTETSDEIGLSLQDPVFERKIAEMSREERNAFIDKMKVDQPIDVHSTHLRDMIQERFFNDHMHRADTPFGVGESLFSPTFMWDEWGERHLTEADKDHAEKQFHTWLDKTWSARVALHYLVDEDEYQAQAGSWFGVRQFLKLLKSGSSAEELKLQMSEVTKQYKALTAARAEVEKVRSGALAAANMTLDVDTVPALAAVAEAAAAYEKEIADLAAKLIAKRDSLNASDEKLVEVLKAELPESVQASLDGDMLGDDGLHALAEFAFTLSSFVNAPLEQAQAAVDANTKQFADTVGLSIAGAQAVSAFPQLVDEAETLKTLPPALVAENSQKGAVLTKDLAVDDAEAFLITNKAQTLHLRLSNRVFVTENKAELLKVFNGVPEQEQEVLDYLLRGSRGLNNTNQDNPKAWWHVKNEQQAQWAYLDDEWKPYLSRLNLGPMSRLMLKDYTHLKKVPMPLRHYVGGISMYYRLTRKCFTKSHKSIGMVSNRTWNVVLFTTVVLSVVPWINSQIRYSGKVWHDSFFDFWHPAEFQMPWYRAICFAA